MQKFQFLDHKTHGTPHFPVEYYRVDHRHPRYRMAFHWHKEWELLRVLEGEFRLTLNEEEYCIRAPQTVLISPETLHGGEPCNAVYECLVFNLYDLFKKCDALKPALSPFYKNERIPHPLCLSQSQEAADLLELFHREVSPSAVPDTVAGILKLFSALLCQKGFRTARAEETPWSARIKAVLEYIEAHFQENLSLDTLAEVAGMNSRYFCRVFYGMTRHTPMNYVNFYRIEHAAFLLESTDLPITRIATDCGFWESSYFTKVFKKYRNCTPRQYRAKIKKGI